MVEEAVKQIHPGLTADKEAGDLIRLLAWSEDTSGELAERVKGMRPQQRVSFLLRELVETSGTRAMMRRDVTITREDVLNGLLIDYELRGESGRSALMERLGLASLLEGKALEILLSYL